MRGRKITDADLNAFVDRELDANDLVRVSVHLLADPESAKRVGAYAGQRRTLAALRVAIEVHRSNPRLKALEAELCRLVRQQARRSLARSAQAAAQPRSPG